MDLCAHGLDNIK